MKMTILNLTQHPATPAQREAGVVDLIPRLQAHLREYLTFDTIPSPAEVELRAKKIARMASDANFSTVIDAAMIGGAPYLMAPLEKALRVRGFPPLYAFSVRESTEVTLPDGSVQKQTTFRHQGFVAAGETE